MLETHELRIEVRTEAHRHDREGEKRASDQGGQAPSEGPHADCQPVEEEGDPALPGGGKGQQGQRDGRGRQKEKIKPLLGDIRERHQNTGGQSEKQQDQHHEHM